MMLGLKIERFFISDQGHEMAFELSYHLPAEKAPELIQGHLALSGDEIAGKLDLPPELGTWREMTDDEAKDYLARRDAPEDDEDEEGDED